MPPFLLPVWAFIKGLKLSHVALIALAGLCLFYRVSLSIEQRHSGKLQHRVNELTALRAEDARRYKQAQLDAATKNKAEVAKIEAEQEATTDEVKRDLTARLERLRILLRAQAAQGQAGRPNLPEDGRSGAGTAPEAGLCLTPEQLLRGAENEERHDQLITWVERQLQLTR